jgi:hypothetical protein
LRKSFDCTIEKHRKFQGVEVDLENSCFYAAPTRKYSFLPSSFCSLLFVCSWMDGVYQVWMESSISLGGVVATLLSSYLDSLFLPESARSKACPIFIEGRGLNTRIYHS